MKIPTGYLLVKEYSKGKLETLSIGDYGKAKNVKADFLGYHNEISGVPNGECMPLSEKWVVTLSTQYGCPMHCTFCDVPKIPFKGNVSFQDLCRQLSDALAQYPDVHYTERLNIHFARMGEPVFNPNVTAFASWLYKYKKNLPVRVEVIHPVLTTSMPNRYVQLESRLQEWCRIKNEVYNGQAGLQFSINSTNEQQRNDMFARMQLSLIEISAIASRLPDPIGRKYCLNFAYATGFEIDAQKLSDLFDTNNFMVKITPIHNNNACRENKIETINGYDSWEPYRQPEEDLKDAGFDVIVFIPSMDEENSLVTCGNAVLGEN